MVVEAGAGRDQANPAGPRVHKDEENFMLKVALAVERSLRTMNCTRVQMLVRS